MTGLKSGAPPLIDLVLGGDGQTEAVAINDFIYMAKDVSNAYLVRTSDGDVLINAGTVTGAEQTRRLFEPLRTGPLRYIILTQSHPDHFGGVEKLREADTKILAERRYPEIRRYYVEMKPFFKPRTGKLWARTLAKQGSLIVTPLEVTPDILFDDRMTIECGGRTFELISTPGGETLDSFCVWMPQEGVVFTGNLFGPMFMGVPNLNTVRGDKPRTVERFLRSLETVRDLGAETLITGHGDPVCGVEEVRLNLDKLHAAMTYIDEATKAGMNAGKDMHTLMREIHLPPDLEIGEWHGKISWAVKAIWHEYSGWFLYESTTELYGVPRSAVDRDFAELAGGADKLAERAARHLDADRPLEAMHLLDAALGAEPANKLALQTKRSVLERLQQSGTTNLSEAMWLKAELDEVTEALG